MNVKKYFSFLLIVTLFFVSYSDKVYAVFLLDAGHGAPDGGTVGYSGSVEKDINLFIVLKTGVFLSFLGVDHAYTRTGDNSICDHDAKTIREKKISDLKNRLSIACSTENALFISFHMNASTSRSAKGFQIFYGRNYQSSELAASLTRFFLTQPIGHSIREVKQAPDSVFLTNSLICPSVILEYGYLSNPEEEALLIQEQHQDILAAVTAFALLNYTNQRG